MNTAITGNRKLVPELLAPLFGLGVGIANNEANQDARDHAEAEAAEAAAAADLRSIYRAQTWQKNKSWLIPAAITVAVVLTLIIIRSTR